VEVTQLIFGAVLVLVLVGFATYAAWRQWQVLLRLRTENDWSLDERQFMRRMAWRRIICSALMIIFAGMLIGSYFIEPAERPQRPADAAAENPEPKPALNREERVFSYYWILALLVLLGVITLAAVDLLATRRFGLRQYRQIQADRRAMIATQVARLRRERNGHFPGPPSQPL
jgi:hypothetical protein